MSIYLNQEKKTYQLFTQKFKRNSVPDLIG